MADGEDQKPGQSGFWSESDEAELSRKRSLGEDEVDFLADIDAELARQKAGPAPAPVPPAQAAPEPRKGGDGSTATGYCPGCGKLCERMRFLDDGANAWVFCMACGWRSGDAELVAKMRAAIASRG